MERKAREKAKGSTRAPRTTTSAPKKFVEFGKVEQAARGSRPESREGNSTPLQKAERYRQRSTRRGEDSALKTKP